MGNQYFALFFLICWPFYGMLRDFTSSLGQNVIANRNYRVSMRFRKKCFVEKTAYLTPNILHFRCFHSIFGAKIKTISRKDCATDARRPQSTLMPKVAGSRKRGRSASAEGASRRPVPIYLFLSLCVIRQKPKEMQ